MGYKNMDAIDVFCNRLLFGGDFLGEQCFTGPISLSIGWGMVMGCKTALST
jgi:hypothetical protein